MQDHKEKNEYLYDCNLLILGAYGACQWAGSVDLLQHASDWKSITIAGRNEEKLKQKTQKLEYRLFPEAIIKIFKKN